MPLEFTKMHGLGNDFMVIDTINQEFTPAPEPVRQLANRHTGVGFDQLLVVAVATSPDTDFHYRIFNADGSEVDQCGNGARCFMRFVHDRGLTEKRQLRVGTRSGPLELTLEDDGDITVDMGEPKLAPADIPFDAPDTAVLYPLEIDGQTVELSAISMGNPHAVIRVADIENAPVTQWGPLIEHHPRFPQRVNAGFMEIIDRETIRVRVFERGAGETLACGSGACAAVVAGKLQGALSERVKVILNGGNLVVSWAGEGCRVLMTGSATNVFEGHIEL